jgi:hypothetical protein
MSILEQVEELRQKAIALLLQERATIDQKLNQIGHVNGAEQKKDRKQITCGRCGLVGHTARKCPTPGTAPA